MKDNEKRLFNAIGEIDDSYIEDASPENDYNLLLPTEREHKKTMSKREIRKAKNPPETLFKRKIRWGVCLSLVLILSLWLFIPYRTTPPSVARFSRSEYYSVIQKLNSVTYVKPKYKNNFDKLINNLFPLKFGAAPDNMEHIEYVETTDNQVHGIIEGDLLKRSNENIFYLNSAKKRLEIYGIDKENTQKTAEYEIKTNPSGYYSPYTEWEMFLSTDLTTVTVIAPYVILNPDSIFGGKNFYEIITLDISDIKSIKEVARVGVSGQYNTSRLVDGNLLVISNFTVQSGANFAEEKEFLPQIKTADGVKTVELDNLYMPDTVTSSTYTVLCKIDQKTSKVEGFTSFLSYSNAVYVSHDYAYITRSYSQKVPTEQKNKNLILSKTEIIPVSYGGDALEVKQSISVDGNLLNQYSLDEYEGNLRVVTTTNERIEMTNSTTSSVQNGTTNASLFVVDVENRQIIAKVEKFAPDGESVQSVRFEKNYAYVCTALVVELTDPVFFIDLTDLNDIKIADSGVIDGYSTSLVNFGNGILLGIGVEKFGSFKLETYAVVDGKVDSLDSLVLDGRYAENYKSYYIDRENQLVGLGITGHNSKDKYGNWYCLFGVENGLLTEKTSFALDGNNQNKRAVLIDGYLYAFSEKEYKVEKVL
ncbi:MAG: hypothetical protein E7360_06500 [Clostridiales bacterium]|nr:hypothetical protein [Clostridiales bacterium]